MKGRRLGSGGFGRYCTESIAIVTDISVFVCTHRLEGIQLGTYAVKMVPVGVNRSILLSRIHEVTALERVRHPNVVQYKHSWVETFQHADFGKCHLRTTSRNVPRSSRTMFVYSYGICGCG